MRERGLKHSLVSLVSVSGHVAPHAGAWIETDYLPLEKYGFLSLPMRERGLKQDLT